MPTVGKSVGNRLYVHRSAVGRSVIPLRVQAKIKQARAPFVWAVVKWDKDTDAVSLIECTDWDTADEPTVGRSFLVDSKKVVQPPADPWIYHNKWQFVQSDYGGFNVAESKARSRLWQSLDDVDTSRIGKQSYWQTEVWPQLVGLQCAQDCEIRDTKQAQADLRDRLRNNPAKRAKPSKEVTAQPGSDTTQVASTDRTYKRVAEKLAPLAQGERVLDYGAGLGIGADVMAKVLGKRAVDTFEPLPVRWQGKRPVTFTKDTDIPDQKYAVVVCLNVLNVLEPALRVQVLQSMLRKTASGGMVVIGTRAAESVLKAKNVQRGREASSVWIDKQSQGCEMSVYQKGYTQEELLKYLRSQSSGWDWKPAAVCDIGAVGFRKETT